MTRPSPSEQVNLGYLPGELFTDRPPNQEEYGYSSDDDIESHKYLAIASYAINKKLLGKMQSW